MKPFWTRIGVLLFGVMAVFGNLPERLAVLSMFPPPALAAEVVVDDSTSRLVRALRELDADALNHDEQAELTSMVGDRQRLRLQEANARSSRQWNGIDSRVAWEEFSRERIAALRRSLGAWPGKPKLVETRVTGKFVGDGFKIQNLVYQSRPGLWVTANLYLPARPANSMPGIVICHSHHRPKEHGELQDMGMTWARGGCAVLVPDHLGHGERGQHPFRSADDFAGEFQVSRQDYYHRYDNGLLLDLVGDSLAGWMAWDLMRGIDVLLARGDVDPKRIILLGAVAGGGDVAAVTAALDERIAAVVPFNFGGPQGFTRYPLPDDAETSFNYAGSGSWESTRNLRRSAAEDFLPWVIVGSVAPRPLIYAHEFRWDRDRDPVWKRLQAIWQLHDVPDHLAFAHGRGSVKGRPPEATHCTHIGPPHRAMLHPALDRWLKLGVSADDEYSNRLPAEQLACLSPAVREELKLQALHQLVDEQAERQIAAFRRSMGTRPVQRETPPQNTGRGPMLPKKILVQRAWQERLGSIEPRQAGRVMRRDARELVDAVQIERIVLEVEHGIRVPMLLLLPPAGEKAKPPVVVALSRSGKESFLKQRTEAISQLLSGGAAVCLPDVRGTGETRSDNAVGPRSAATSQSSNELMLAGTMLGARLRDLRSVLRYLKSRPDLDASRTALWGDSFAEVNSAETGFKVPRRSAVRPAESQPLGGLLALLSGLYEEQVRAVAIHGGLSDYRSVLSHWAVYIPHDAVVPNLLSAGDLPEVAVAFAPRPLRLTGMVDGLNRRVPVERLSDTYAPARQAYEQAGHSGQLVIDSRSDSLATWLLETVVR